MERINVLINNKLILSKEDGSTSVEYAILLPFFLMLLLGVTEFGIYFARDEIASNAVNTVIQNIQRNQNYYNGMTASQLTAAEKSLGLGMMDFTKPGYYLCVQAFATANAAASAGACTSTNLTTGANPNGAGNPYYLSVQANLPSASTITPLGHFVSSVTQIQLQQTSGAVQVGLPLPTAACTGDGNFLQYNNGFQCGQLQQTTNNLNCSEPWERVVFESGSPQCISVPYIFAAGIANATSPNGTGTWSTNDATKAPWIANVATWYQASTTPGGYYLLPYTTLCVPISFTVPAGLPAGQIIAQGNLFYPGPNNDGQWKGWVVSFGSINAGPAPPTTSAYAGSADLCIASGGNWETFGEGPPWPPNPDVSPFTGFGSTVAKEGNPPGIASEHESWTITFIPSSVYTGSR